MYVTKSPVLFLKIMQLFSYLRLDVICLQGLFTDLQNLPVLSCRMQGRYEEERLQRMVQEEAVKFLWKQVRDVKLLT